MEKIPLIPEREVHRLKGAFTDFYTGDEYDQYKEDFIEIEFTDEDVVTNPIGLLKRKFPYLLSIKQNRSPAGQSKGLAGPQYSHAARSTGRLSGFLSIHSRGSPFGRKLRDF